MSEHRPVKHYKTLPEIIQALSPGKVGNAQTYVGKQYNKEALINDLQRIDSLHHPPEVVELAMQIKVIENIQPRTEMAEAVRLNQLENYATRLATLILKENESE